jgi:hypothetical protein
MNGISIMIPAGGDTRASLERRLMNDAINAAGSSLWVHEFYSCQESGGTYGDARKVSRRRKNRARYLTCMTSRSSRPYNLW